jgi:hypothetical protein
MLPRNLTVGRYVVEIRDAAGNSPLLTSADFWTICTGLIAVRPHPNRRMLRCTAGPSLRGPIVASAE